MQTIIDVLAEGGVLVHLREGKKESFELRDFLDEFVLWVSPTTFQTLVTKPDLLHIASKREEADYVVTEYRLVEKRERAKEES